MDFSSVRKNVQFSKDSLLCPALILLIVWGLLTKVFISINLRLDSDAVGIGLMSMEIGKHHNYLLSGCHLLSTDSLVSTELIPFQLIPQILTNYNPVALKFMVFFIFCLSVLTLAYLVWFVSGDVLSALLFGALAANIPPEGYFWLAYPTTHNATILFGAAILVILFHINRSVRPQQEKNGKTRKKKTGETYNTPRSYSIVLAMLVFLSVFSDTIILVWVLLPFILAYLLFYEKKTGIMNFVIISLVITSVAAYIFKTYIIPGWITTNYGINSISEIFFVNIPLFFKAQLLLLNQGLSALMGGSAAVGPVEIISIVFFAAVIIFSIKNGWYSRVNASPEKRLLYTMLLISVLVMFGSFIVSGYVHNITSARYLTFTALALLMLVAISCPVTEKTCVFCVLSLLVISAIAGSLSISTINPNPNEREFNLIADLKGQNLTNGYGTYWDSNIITYLSGETVIIRSTYFSPDDVMQDLLNSCDRWYTNRPDRMFIIYDTTVPEDKAQKNYPLLVKPNNTSRILHYRDYEIYPFNISD